MRSSTSFKIGDLVQVSLDHINCRVAGRFGRIVADPLSSMPGVEFPFHFGGHTCNDAGSDGRCLWIYKEQLTKPVTRLENK